MKKPNSIKQLLGFIFLIMGVLFSIFGYLSKIGILTAKANSKGDPAVVFPIMGSFLLIGGILFFFISLYQEKKRKELKEKGVEVQGVVEKIRKLSYTHWGNQSPYRIYFSYVANQAVYHGISPLLWETPALGVGDTIPIHIDLKRTHVYLAEI